MINKKILIIIVTFIIFNFNILYAATTNSYDFSTIKYNSTLSEDYSYSTLYYTNGTTFTAYGFHFANTSTGNKGNRNDLRYSYGLRGNASSPARLKITKCAIDKDGDLCDVVCTISDIQTYSNSDSYSTYSEYKDWFPGANFSSGNPRVCFSVKSYYTIAGGGSYGNSVGNLIAFSFNTTYASAIFQMDYYKTGTWNSDTNTGTKANMGGVNAFIYDLDIPSPSTTTLGSNFFLGEEGFQLQYDGDYYFDKSSNGFLQHRWNTVGTNSSKNNVENTGGIHQYSSCFAVQKQNASFKMKYGGSYCGIEFAFVSPFKYQIPNPTSSVSPSKVYEGEKYTYTTSQYIPNNYYGSLIPFIGVNTHVSQFVIEKNILTTKNTVTTSDVTITNEDNQNVTSYFDISIANNKVKATLKSSYKDDLSFYSHRYNLNIKESYKVGYGLSNTTVSEGTSSVTIDSTKAPTLRTVNLKYDVNTTGFIDYGIISCSTNKSTVDFRANNSYTVTFTPASSYILSKVLINDDEIDISKLTKNGNTYSYTFTNNDIRKNISQSIVVKTLKQCTITTKYVDEFTGKSISNDVSNTIIEGQTYSTSKKEISGYTYSKVVGNTSGTVGNSDITVTYYYKKNTSVEVIHKDKFSGDILDTEKINGYVGDTFNSKENVYDMYVCVTRPNKESIILTDSNEILIYEYAKLSKVTVIYKDVITNEELDRVVEIKKQGDSFTSEEKVFDNYNLYDKPENETITVERDDVELVYVYKKIYQKVTVKYIDENSGKSIVDDIVLQYKDGDNYITEEKAFDGYSLTSKTDNISGVMPSSDIVVEYRYKKISAGVEIRYVDKDSGEDLSESTIKTGLEKTPYTSMPKEIEGYELIEIPENANGEMSVEKITVIYKYSLIKGKIALTKVDKNDNNKFLSGATFKLEKIDELGNIIEGFMQEKTTDINGNIEFGELLVGSYKIIEIKAPEGYELSYSSIEVDITKDNRELNILASNKLKLLLPKTGKINNSIYFIVIGGLLMIGIKTINRKIIKV